MYSPVPTTAQAGTPEDFLFWLGLSLAQAAIVVLIALRRRPL